MDKINIVEINTVRPPGYTDFINIYISNVADKQEREVLIKHESLHIWLQHQSRTLALRDVYGNKLNLRILNIAFDLEIAKHFYTDEDVEVICKPRGILKDGIIPEHCEEFPNCEYAEEFYEELIKKNEEQLEQLKSFDSVLEKFLEDAIQKELDQMEPQDVKALVEKAKENIEENEKQKNISNLQYESEKYTKNLKPSLSSSIDALIGRRFKVTRKASYRRPPRYNEGEFIKKGMITTSSPPHLTLYVDRSGSFNENKTREATSKITEILTKYRGRIDKDVYYFNDRLMTVDPVNGGGGTNYQCVVDHIIETSSQLSIVITDNDGCNIQIKGTIPNVIIIPVGCSSTNLKSALNSSKVIEIN